MYYDFNATHISEKLEKRIDDVFNAINEAEKKLHGLGYDSLAIDECREILKRAYLDNKPSYKAEITMVKDVCKLADKENK